MALIPDPSYGTTLNYSSKEGEIYFQKQKAVGQVAARWNLHFYNQIIGANDRILDFGCGGGFLLHELVCCEKIGVDINPAARQCAEALGIRAYSTLDELGDRKFTKIISNHALEHVPSPLTALQKLNSLLEHSGILVLLLPMEDWRASEQRKISDDDAAHHLYTWTPRTLANLLLEAKFKPLSVEVVMDAMPPRYAKEIITRFAFIRPFVGYITAALLLRRQLFAVAKKSA